MKGWWIAAIVAAGLARPGAAEETIDVAPAMRAAEAWLESVDTAAYGRAWQDAAPVFQESIARVKWETTMESARQRLGMLIRRKLRTATYTRNLPGSPPGEYVVIEYDTAFEHRLVAETVTPVRTPAGEWRVSGYVMR